MIKDIHLPISFFQKKETLYLSSGQNIKDYGHNTYI